MHSYPLTWLSGTCEDALMKANHNVTEVLQRTIGLMQKELERNVLSSQLLGKFFLSINCNSPIRVHNTRLTRSHPWYLQTTYYHTRKDRLARSHSHNFRPRHPLHTEAAHHRLRATYRLFLDEVCPAPAQVRMWWYRRLGYNDDCVGQHCCCVSCAGVIDK
ncbi:hypothetical protein F4604DRAFT_686814 [Suillus subluteus]|nr:hypothetical protein F4604DRAFT_686814 [Suillus subluteus]